MNYIIFDLEWNNAYNYSTGKGMNEIIEIGAIKLDEKFNMIDTFKQLIKPKLSKKLSGRFKDLTHISNQEVLENGIPFDEAITDFSNWCGEDDNIFMSWSDSDLYALIDNFKKFMGTTSISFFKKYVDMQKYCQSFIENIDNNQISLINCAQKFDISADTENLHRALEDCYLSAKCVEKVFDVDKFNSYIVNCDNNFFERLVYKPYIITKPVSSNYNIYKEKLECPICKKQLKMIKNYELINKSFRAICECKNCRKKYWIYIRVKKEYDKVNVSKKISVMNKKRAKTIDKRNKIR